MFGLDTLLKESMSIAFERDGLGQVSYNDYAVVANRLMDKDIDITKDKMSPEHISILSEMVMDYVDEKAVLSEVVE
jgi:hypothetical protein